VKFYCNKNPEYVFVVEVSKAKRQKFSLLNESQSIMSTVVNNSSLNVLFSHLSTSYDT